MSQSGVFGPNPAGPQCVNVPNTWAHRVGRGAFEGNAVDFIGQRPRGWRWVSNGPTNVPRRGSVVVFFGPETGELGHVDVFLFGTQHFLVGLDQNWPDGSPCRRVRHDYLDAVGWFEPARI